MACLFAVSIIIIVTSQTETSLATLPKSRLRVEKSCEEVCDTDVCQHEADLILSAINNTVDPCQDFYGFVCGKWLLCNPIPDDQESISFVHKSAERVTNDIGTILNTTIFKYENQNATDKAIIFYKSCLRQVNFTEKQRIMSKILKKKGLTMWPSLPGELNPTETVEALFARLGWKSIVDIHIGPDEKNNSRHVLMMRQPNLGLLDRDELIDTTDPSFVNNTNFYKSMLVKYMMLFRKNITEDIVIQSSNDLYNLNVEIAKLTKSSKEVRATSHRSHNLWKLGNLTSHDVMHQPNLGLLDRDELIDTTDPSFVNKTIFYKSMLVKYMMLFRKNITEDIAIQLSNDLYNLNVEIAKLTKSSKEVRATSHRSHNIWKLGNLTSHDVNINWTKLLNADFSRVNITVDEEEDIIIKDLEYYPSVMKLLSKTNRTTLKNFLGWKIVSEYGLYAYEELQKMMKQFEIMKYGASSSHPDWMRCAKVVRRAMSGCVDRMYVEQKFDSRAKEEVKNIAKAIIQEFEEMLSKDNWIDNETEEEAIKKLKTMGLKIGYPDWILNDTALEKYYEFVGDILPDTPFLEIQERIKNNNRLKHYQKLRQPYDKANTWSMPSTEIDAYYHDTSNSIGFPAGILQSPFYSEGLPRALNYGGIGTAIAHEITHAFDDMGRHYDSTGNLRDWWTAKTRELFEKRAQCFVKQYGSIYDEQAHMKLDGHLTLGENIADAGGVKGAFKAYKRQTNLVEEKALSGLKDFTGDQLYFISFALSSCENIRTELLKDVIKNDNHSPPRYRVNTVLQNTEDFAAVFNCSEASKMVIDKKCVMW